MKQPAALAAALAAALLSSCRPSSPSVPPRMAEALGTVCSVNAFEDGTEALYGVLFSRLEEIDARFSVNRPDSAVSRVNAAAGEHSVPVPDDVALVLRSALDYAGRTGGVFDPTIGPLVRLWGISTDHARVPAPEEISHAQSFVGWRDVALSPLPAGDAPVPSGGADVFLRRTGMLLDLGGIAKGYAADELVRLLRERGVRRAIIDLGGNIYVFGAKPDGSPWRVGVKNPYDEAGEPALVLALPRGGSIVTSGVYERFFEQDGERYHHILDPRTGYPAAGEWLSTTIVCESSLAADALSTSAFLLGPEGYAARFGEPAVFIMRDRSVRASPALEGMLSAAQPDFADISFTLGRQ